MSVLISTNISAQTSIWPVILSSAVALAAITGLFYFVGGTEYLGSSQALGLDYLAGLQPAEYIFRGAQLLLFSGFFFAYALLAVWWLWMSVSLRPKPGPYKWEAVIFFGSVLILTVLLGAFTVGEAGVGRDLITSGACPVTGHGSNIAALLALIGIAVVVPIFLYFFSRVLHLAFLAWGIVACLVCLYNFAWATGAARLYGEFQVAEIMSPTAHLPAETNVLVLGADDKNLVVLVSGENSAGHPEPRYLLRSEIKMFRAVGESSIDAFFCKRAVK